MNLQNMAELAQGKNTNILLLTAYLRNAGQSSRHGGNEDKSIVQAFQGYRAMQEKVAEQYDNVHFFDTWNHMLAYQNDDLFIDSNHLIVSGTSE